ncbi:MAG: hypothetical protein IJI14_00805 [Anaerolineaceae bacterium]|nr:hypothetical protein [Anaerolineaceae bacterium]
MFMFIENYRKNQSLIAILFAFGIIIAIFHNMNMKNNNTEDPVEKKTELAKTLLSMFSIAAAALFGISEPAARFVSKLFSLYGVLPFLGIGLFIISLFFCFLRTFSRKE